MVNDNIKSGLISRKQSNINKIIKNVPVNRIKEYLVEYTGELTPRFIPNPNVIFCPQCRAVNEVNAEFCEQCGSKIE